jgi:hypothetical protein
VTRQVRLDDDVVDEVERRADGLSLSGATNLLLRSLLAVDTTTTASGARIDPSEPGPPDAPIDHPEARDAPSATTERLASVRTDVRISASDARIDQGGARALDRPIDHDRSPGSPSATRARRARRPRGRSPFGAPVDATGRFCRHPLDLRVGTRCAACGATAHR